MLDQRQQMQALYMQNLRNSTYAAAIRLMRLNNMQNRVATNAERKKPYDGSDEVFNYTVNQNDVEITGLKNPNMTGEVNVPATIKGKPVKKISNKPEKDDKNTEKPSKK